MVWYLSVRRKFNTKSTTNLSHISELWQGYKNSKAFEISTNFHTLDNSDM